MNPFLLAALIGSRRSITVSVSQTSDEEQEVIMACNVGGIERPVRIVLGVLLIGIGAFAGLPPVGTGIALALGTIALVTGVIGFCPAWSLFGINTCSTRAGSKR